VVQILRTVTSLFVATVFATSVGAAQPARTSAAPAPVHDCDRLAANPPDPDRVVEGVPHKKVDLPAAIAACEKAVASYPREARFIYQLGRVRNYNGDIPRSIEYFRQAAELGYRQAYFILGALINNKREGIEHDTCQLERYWLTASRMGHPAARVSYIRHLTKGYFGACPIGATRAELAQFIDIATPDAEDYYLKLLVADLKEDLTAYLSR
jgi:TPR repeat protein